MNLVVTGASGRIGRLLRRAWRERPPQDIRTFWSSRGQDSDIPWDFHGDTPPRLPEAAIILHLAAVIGGDEHALAQNLSMISAVVDNALRFGACGILFASSAAVYAPSEAPAREEGVPEPANAYGRMKLCAEQLLLERARDHFPCVNIRIGNVVGADALLGGRSGPVTLDPVPGREGGPLRSWIGPESLAEIIASLARRLAFGENLPNTINIAADPPLCMADLLEAAGRDWRYGPPRPGVVPAAVMCTERLRQWCDVEDVSPQSLVDEWKRLQ